MRDSPGVRVELEALSGLVAASRAIVHDGRAVDLHGLDRRVEALCKALQSLDKDDAQRLKPGLIALIDDIDRLRRDLVTQNEMLGAELRRLGAGHKAINAYARPSRR